MSTKIEGFSSPQHGIGALFEDIYLVDGKRTPFGKFTGTLSTVSPTDLGILATKAALEASKVAATEVDQFLCANIGQSSSDAFFLPRHIGLYAGGRMEAPALLLQRICGSGMELIGAAAEQIALKKGDVMAVCGTDAMSRFPLVSYDARQGFQLGKPQFYDLLWEALNDTAAVPMGQTADNVAKKLGLTREEVDAFAKRSIDRQAAALASGFFEDELAPVLARGTLELAGYKERKYKTKSSETFSNDEHPRATTIEQLAKLPFVFSKDGPTTAGTASGIVDGAAAAVIASGDYVRSHSLKPLGKIIGIASVGIDPHFMGLGPVPAIKSLLSKTKLSIKDIDLFEINEAFAAQCLGVARTLEISEDKLNVHGGAIAMGHPLAATGVRLAITCLRGLHARKEKFGIVSACIGGGQGVALLVEAV